MTVPSVLFYAELSTPLIPPDLQTRPVGGSETALVEVARGLARLGHRVVVVAHPGERAGEFDGVEYVDVRSSHWRTRDDIDVTVIFRQLPHAFRKTPGKLRLLWAHDHLGIYPELPPSTRRRLLEIAWRPGHAVFGRAVPGVVAVSRWLADCFVRFAGWPAERVWVIPNGIDGTLFSAREAMAEASAAPRRGHRVVYTSVPERGLELLVRRILPEVWRHVPEVRLDVFSYRPLDAYRSLLDGDDRVRFRGGLAKADLAKALQDFDLWLYPTDFPETSCIAAMEAQAAGLPAVSSRRYALVETIRDGETGVLVAGPVGSRDYVDSFARAVVQLLEQGERRRTMGRMASRWILERFTWDRVARAWSDLLQTLWERHRWRMSAS